MKTNEWQEWLGEDGRYRWRVMARSGNVIAMFPNSDDWAGRMFTIRENAVEYMGGRHRSSPWPGLYAAMEAAIAYAWPESVGTFTERGVAT